jgi:phospholipid-transporting ATPase
MQVMRNFNGSRIDCENPNELLYSFNGKITINENVYGLCLDQMLLRGSSLRNTDWIYGVVVFTGHETKIMKNSIKSKAKLSKLERMTNQYILLMVVIQVFLCLFAALYTTIWAFYVSYEYWYLDTEAADNGGFVLILLINFGTWFIIFMNLVPISLMVTLELVKFAQASFIQWDCNIYDEDKDMEAKA